MSGRRNRFEYLTFATTTSDLANEINKRAQDRWRFVWLAPFYANWGEVGTEAMHLVVMERERRKKDD